MKKLLAVSLVAALLCSACTALADDILRMAWWGSESSNALYLDEAEMFVKATGIEYEPEYLSWDDYWTKMNTLAAAGDLPDVMRQDYSVIKSYADKNLLMDLTPLVESGAIDLSDVDESAYSGGVFDGKLVGINVGSNAFGFITNTALVREAGMELLSEDASWADMEDFVLAFHQKTGLYGIDLECLLNYATFRIFVRSHGGQPYNEDQTAFGFDKQVLIDYLSSLRRLHDAGATQPVAETTTNIGKEDYFFTKGKAALCADWTDSYTTYDNLMKEQYGGLRLSPVPGAATTKAMFVKPSQFFSIPTSAQRVDEAAAFINYWINDLDSNLFVAGRRGVPISNKMATAVAETLDETSQRVFQYINGLSAYASEIYAPDPSANAEIDTEFRKTVQIVLFGESTPEAAAETLFTFAQKALNE